MARDIAIGIGVRGVLAVASWPPLPPHLRYWKGKHDRWWWIP